MRPFLRLTIFLYEILHDKCDSCVQVPLIYQTKEHNFQLFTLVGPTIDCGVYHFSLQNSSGQLISKLQGFLVLTR